MAIERVRTHVVSETLEQPFFFSQFRYDCRTLCLVQVIDDSGAVGWGEGYGPAGPVRAGVEFLAPLIQGEDPLEGERLWRVMHRRAFDHARQGVLVASLSALDVALWDLRGRLLAQPVSTLLGGRRRDTVRAYATGMYFTDGPGLADRLADEARRHRDAGFGAMKMKVGLSVREDVAHVAAVRGALGPDVELMVDANHAYDRREALALARALEPFDIRWFEEPLSPDDLEGFRWLRGQTSIPLATGECECLRAGFRRVLESGGVDIVQPDLCHAGGITETRRIVDMAETFGVEYAPHCWGSAVGLAAAVHLLATRDPIPGRLHDPEPLLELDRTRNVFREELAQPRLAAEGGRVRVPDGPGLGLEIDEALIERFSIEGWVEVTALIGLLVVLALLILAIVRGGVHPFLALTLASLVVGPVMGLSPGASAEEFLVGFGATLKWIGVVIVLGTLLGEVLEASGGVLRIAETVLRVVGSRRLPLAMGLTGYVVSIPAFVDVAYIMLKPVVDALAAKSGRRVLVVGLSLTAGLTATHALLPPTPGPLATAAILGADLGRVIVLNAVVAACALAGGLLWATLYCRRVEVGADRVLREHYVTEAPPSEGTPRPSALASFAPILLPLLLIAAGSFVGEEGSGTGRALLRYGGTPVVALLLGVAVATVTLPRAGRLGRLRSLTERAIERSAVVMMITGAGGGLGGVIKASGVGDQIAAAFGGLALPGLLLPFLLAMALTTATGSLTVAMVTSSAVVAPLLPTLGLSPEMAVALVGAGSLSLIHANSSFFWLLSRLHDVRPDVLYRTYSVQSLCMGLGALLGILVLKLLGVS